MPFKTETAPRGALEGVRILDIATMAAGPWAATYLADWGADVIKVEHPRDGDHVRRWGMSKDDVPLFWKSISRNKRHITVNMSHPQGRQVILDLVRHCDAVVENFRPGVLERWGLGFDELVAVRPDIILLRTTAFGQDGPYARRPGFGTLAEAMSGLAHMTGQADGPPTLAAYPLADGVAGLAGAMALLAALYHRDALGGGGQVIDNAIAEANLRLIEYMVPEHEKLGVVPQRQGNRLPGLAPRNAYPTRDNGYIAISGGTQSIVQRLFNALGRPELIDDPRFATAAARVANVAALDAVIGGWIVERTVDEVMEVFDRHEVAGTPVADIAQVFRNQHYVARQAIVEVEDDDFGTVKTLAPHPRLSATPGTIRKMGGRMGRDLDDVLTGLLDYDAQHIAALRATGAI
jgi:crotonobetainyl-CoA:carnitine CoA-transferase CaiB-like acyl-CoA transferase